MSDKRVSKDNQSTLIDDFKASEERYQAFIQNSNEGIWRFELDKPIPVTETPTKQIDLMFKHAYLAEANLAMAKMYGLKSVKEILGTRLADFMKRDDPANIEYLTAFVTSGYSLTDAESHETDTKGNDKYFRNSLVGFVENGKLIRAWGTQSDVTEKYRADEALRASEERLALALEASNMGMWEWDVVNDKLIWSDRLKKLFGLSISDKITYAKYLSMIHPSDVKLTQKIIKESMKSGKSYKFEHRVKWPDGSIHWIFGQGRAYLQNGKPVRMVGTSMNIDKRKLAEIDMHKSEERLTRALKASSMGYWEWDLKTNELMWSKEIRKLFGVGPEDEITYEKYLSILHPDDRERVDAVIKRALKNGKPYTIEDRVIWPDGSVHWLQRHGQAFLVDGKPVRMVGTSMNIDKRKLYEVKVQESELRFRNMADAAPVLIWVAGPDKMLTYFNKPWRDFTGRKLDDDLGDGWHEVIHPEDLRYIDDVYKSSFDKKEPYRAEYRIRRHDGKYLWMLDKGAPRYSPSGEFLGFVGSLIEVEEIKSTKKRQQELEEINKKLELQQKQLVELNSTKDEFISVASHQLRTPATGVKQYIGMVLEGYGGDLSDTQIKMLHTAYESNERQLRIIDDLLKVAHVDAGKVSLSKTRTNIVELIEDAIDEQADTFKDRRQGITFRHKAKEVIVPIDAARMRMVIENLIDNASKYSQEGKSVEVVLRKRPKFIEFCVCDQGVGIAKRDITQLFQKFSRIENELSTQVGGSGLGLYWVKKIVTLHGGTISVTSKRHQGTTFTMIIPREESRTLDKIK